MTSETIQDTSPPPSLARNAGLLALGNIASRVFGLVREMVISHYFGATGQVSAFRIAAQAPTLLYDFLVGGMLSAALVPVLSDYARRDRGAFIRLVQVLVSLFMVVLAALTLLLEVATPPLTTLLAGGFRTEHPELLALTNRLMRLSAPMVWLLGVAGVLAAVLYAQQRFSFPALATAVYNLGIVVVAPLLAFWWGITTLVIGLLVGGVAQLLLLGWDLRRSGIALAIRWDWRHPALRRILTLYAPIAGSMVVALFQVGLDRRLASGTGEQSIAWMANATTLQQLPLGLISVAIALAALPSLSRSYAARDEEGFRQTLVRGLRMILVLILPAAVALWLLGEPVTRLIFEHGAFTPDDTVAVARALDIYLVGMLFAALDFPLNYAFYARNNTLTPALVGVLSVGVYVVFALALVGPLSYLGLVWADTAKQASHALVIFALLYRQLGHFERGGLRKVAPIVIAGVGMAAATGLVAVSLTGRLPAGWLGDFSYLSLAGGVGAGVYCLILARLDVPEMRAIARLVWRR
jgi:putative peptidoglycan lipid II flippase